MGASLAARVSHICPRNLILAQSNMDVFVAYRDRTKGLQLTSYLLEQARHLEISIDLRVHNG